MREKTKTLEELRAMYWQTKIAEGVSGEAIKDRQMELIRLEDEINQATGEGNAEKLTTLNRKKQEILDALEHDQRAAQGEKPLDDEYVVKCYNEYFGDACKSLSALFQKFENERRAAFETLVSCAKARNEIIKNRMLYANMIKSAKLRIILPVPKWPGIRFSAADLGIFSVDVIEHRLPQKYLDALQRAAFEKDYTPEI